MHKHTRPLLHLAQALLLLVMTLFPALAGAETNLDVQLLPEGFLVDDTWGYVGHTLSGVTFAIPEESVHYPLRASDKQAGILMLYGNGDYMLQLRVFEPEVRTYAKLKRDTGREPTADWHTEIRDDTEFLFYRNTKPGAQSELYGIATVGLDGKLYKISIFTGSTERFDDDAPVWRIAEVVAATARVRDFASWGVDTWLEEPD